MPVWEAFQCLKGEHLIELLQYKGAVVKPLDAKTVADIYDVRCAVEVLIMTNVYKNGLTPEMVDRLLAINDLIDYEKPLPEINRCFAETNELFHKSLFSVCDNQQAKDMYVFYSNLLQALKKRYPISVERIRTSQAEHYKMLEAVCEGDLETVKSITTLHALGAKQDLLGRMKEETPRERKGAGKG